MQHLLKVLLIAVVFTFIGGIAQAQEETMTQKFAAEEASAVNPMAEGLAKLKNGVGIRFNSDSMFGISVNKGVKVGFKVKF